MFSSPYRPKARLGCVCLSLLLLASCVESTPPGDKIDPSGNLSRKDYLAMRHRGSAMGVGKKDDKDKTDEDDDDDDDDIPGKTPHKTKKPDETKIPPIPSMPSVAVPPPDISKEDMKDKRVNLSITENVPLREVLLALGRDANVNMEIDPNITGGVIFTAHDQPFHMVLRRLCDMAGLRYTKGNGFIRIEVDEPFQKTYAVDYLSMSRKATNEIGIATNVFDVDVSSTSGSGTHTSSNSNNNSISKISGASESDFWSELEKSLTQVLVSSGKMRTFVANAPKNDDRKKPESNFSLDRQAGLVTIYGNSAQQKAAETYLQKLQQKASAQVLIEARVVEVALDDAYQSGINWRTLFSGAANVASRFGTVGAAAPYGSASTATDGLFTASLKTGDFAGIMSLVETFGTTRVLSSPRLTVLNNQPAVLKVAKNAVYFITTAQYSTATNSSGTVVSGTPVFTSTPKTVPVGFVMTVQPAIDKEHKKVTMTLRPTVSRIVDYVNDPSIALNAAEAGITTSVTSQIPVLAVREMDSVVQLDSGEVAIMGGLMQDSSINQDQGVPVVDTVPLIGNLAKSRSTNGSTSELVVILRATILDNPTPDNADADVYQHYTSDPRALPMHRTTQDQEKKE